MYNEFPNIKVQIYKFIYLIYIDDAYVGVYFSPSIVHHTKPRDVCLHTKHMAMLTLHARAHVSVHRTTWVSHSLPLCAPSPVEERMFDATKLTAPGGLCIMTSANKKLSKYNYVVSPSSNISKTIHTRVFI